LITTRIAKIGKTASKILHQNRQQEFCGYKEMSSGGILLAERVTGSEM
jgi:hypothetical protein